MCIMGGVYLLISKKFILNSTQPYILSCIFVIQEYYIIYLNNSIYLLSSIGNKIVNIT